MPKANNNEPPIEPVKAETLEALTISAEHAEKLEGFFGSLPSVGDWTERVAGILPKGVDLAPVWPAMAEYLDKPVRGGLTPSQAALSAKGMRESRAPELQHRHEQSLFWHAMAQVTEEAAKVAVGTDQEKYTADWAYAAALKRDYYASQVTPTEVTPVVERARGREGR